MTHANLTKNIDILQTSVQLRNNAVLKPFRRNNNLTMKIYNN